MLRSIRWRLTIYHAIAILGIAFLLTGIGLFAFYQSVRASVQEAARGRAIAAERLLAGGTIPQGDALASLSEREVFVVIRDGQGAVLAEAGAPPPGLDRIDQPDRDRAWQAALATDEPSSDSPAELYVYVLPIDTGASGAAVIEAWKSYDATAEGYLIDVRVLTVLVPAAVLLAIAGSWFLVGATLRPIRNITASAREIEDDSLDRRLPVERNDEIGELAATFNDLLARLELAMQERDEALEQQRRFLADASHELRTPLTAIRGYARMLDDWALDDPTLARESVDAIERDATRMTILVERLLQLARGDDPDVAPRLAPVDLAELAAGAVEDAHMLAHDRVSITLSTPEPVETTADGMQLRQVIDILLDNAVKHTPDGGQIAVSVASAAEAVEIAVTDTGPGIPEEQLPYIFDRFYRADPSRTTPGSGLGLAIAKQIVARHGGSLTAENHTGGGARFTVRLPAAGPVTPGGGPG